jgi:hypothetical protein
MARDGIIALVVLVPVALVLGRCIGDLLPMLAFFAVAAFDIFAAPSIPGSPDACMNHHGSCAGHQAGVGWLAFGIPLAVAVAIKMRRGDKRGVTGSRPLFGRRR